MPRLPTAVLVILCLLTLFAFTQTTMADAGYLFVTFKGEQSPMTEQIYFAVSTDGRNWEALNGGQPTLVSGVGEKGVRDPFLVRSHDGKKFFLIATDLSINLNRDWGRASRAASKSIVIWESEDLVQWSEPRLVKVAADDAGCTWAPEAVYDETTQEYLVFWASRNGSDHFAKFRIWAARTKDFKSFDKAFIYIDKPNDVIDTDIVWENGTYYRFTKDEKFKAVTMETCDTLAGEWKDVSHFSLAKLSGYEGPACFRLQPPKGAQSTTQPAGATQPSATWCLLLDHYSKGAGYQPYVTTDLSKGLFTAAPDFKFPFKFRHGSVLPITAGEMERVKSKYAKAGTPEKTKP